MSLTIVALPLYMRKSQSSFIRSEESSRRMAVGVTRRSEKRSFPSSTICQYDFNDWRTIYRQTWSRPARQQDGSVHQNLAFRSAQPALTRLGVGPARARNAAQGFAGLAVTTCDGDVAQRQ